MDLGGKDSKAAEREKMPNMAVILQKSTSEFLQMTKFDPETQAPLYGPLGMAWIADSEAQAIAQAACLGQEDHEAVRIEFARADVSQIAEASPVEVAAVIANCNTRVFTRIADADHDQISRLMRIGRKSNICPVITPRAKPYYRQFDKRKF